MSALLPWAILLRHGNGAKRAGELEEGERTRVIPIFRASFQLTDRKAHDRAVALCRNWIGQKGGAGLEFRNGEPGDFSAPDCRGTTRAIAHEDGRIWAARLEDLRSAGHGQTWTTDLFVESRGTGLVRFGAELVLRSSAPVLERFGHSRPRVVRDILAQLSAEADGVALTESAETVTLEAFESFLDLLTRPRRLPVVALSRDAAGLTAIDPGNLARDLAGGAHLRIVDADASWELTRSLGKAWSVYNRAIRLYLPGVSEDDDPYRHPLSLLTPGRPEQALLAWLAAHVLPFGFRDRDQDARFWRIGLLQQVAGPTTSGSAGEIASLKTQLAEAMQEKESAEALMDEADNARERAEQEAARLRHELEELRASLATLPSSAAGPGASAADVAPLVTGDLTVPAALRLVLCLFPHRLEILPSAVRSADQSAGFKDPERALDLLWTLATAYWAKLAGGEGDVEARKVFGKAYAPKEAATLSERGRALRTFRWNGTDIFMERHLKIGVKDSAAETLRIHFHWDGACKRIVVGHCGPHLDF